MSLRLIETFIEAARLGSFSAAGRSLGLSPGSVSQNIKNLEDQLGVRLFDRTTRRTRLTAEGERYRSRCAPALEALAEAAEAAREDRDGFAGRLRLTATTAFGRSELLPIIAEFQRAHPKLGIEVKLSDLFVDLVAEGFDLAVRAGTLPENDYVARLILPMTPLLCAAPAYLAEAGVPTSLAEMAGHRLIGMRSNPTNQLFAWDFAGPTGEVERHPIDPNFIVNDPGALLQAALLGMGIGQIGSVVCAPSIASGALRVLLPERAIRSRGVYAVYPSRRFTPKKVSAFVALLIERLSNRADLSWTPDRQSL